MKKFLCLIMIFTLIFSLVSCGNVASGSPTDTSTETGTNETIDTSKPIITDSPATPPMETGNYAEYLKFIETTDLPDNFVTYDQTRGFGEFYYFALPEPDICDRYYYYVKHGKNEKYTITLSSSETLSSTISGKTTVSVADIADLLSDGLNVLYYSENLPQKTYLLFSDILYIYEKNELAIIFWENDGILYKLEGNFDVAIISHEIISKLLVLDTAEEALAEIKSWSNTTEPEATE